MDSNGSASFASETSIFTSCNSVFIFSPLLNQNLSTILSSTPSCQDGDNHVSERPVDSNEFSRSFFSVHHQCSQVLRTLYPRVQQILQLRRMSFANNPAIHLSSELAGLLLLHHSSQCLRFRAPQRESPIWLPCSPVPRFRLHLPTQAPGQGNAARWPLSDNLIRGPDARGGIRWRYYSLQASN